MVSVTGRTGPTKPREPVRRRAESMSTQLRQSGIRFGDEFDEEDDWEDEDGEELDDDDDDDWDEDDDSDDDWDEDDD